MLQISKNEPSFFSIKKSQISNPNQSSSWAEIGDIRSDLRKHILCNEQNNMCAYCEKKIISDRERSNIDHFKTRNTYPELTFEYSNLFVSCNNTYHCSSKKDNANLTREDFSNLISPLENDGNNFTFSRTGDILGANEKANFTKDTFELNQISLTEERKAIILNFEYYKDLPEEELINSLNGHSSLIKYLKRL